LSPTGSGVVHLDFPDSQYWTEDGIEPPTALRIADVLRPHVDDADKVYVPAGIHNADHKLVRDATLTVRPDATFYGDLPYALHPDLGGFHLPLDANRPDRVRRDVQLDEHSAAAKVEACRRYSTQLRQLTETFGRFVNAVDLGLEVFWEAT